MYESNGCWIASTIDSQLGWKIHINHLLDRLAKADIGSLDVSAGLSFLIQTDQNHTVVLTKNVLKAIGDARLNLTITFD